MTRRASNPPRIFVLDDGTGIVAKRLEYIPNGFAPSTSGRRGQSNASSTSPMSRGLGRAFIGRGRCPSREAERRYYEQRHGFTGGGPLAAARIGKTGRMAQSARASSNSSGLAIRSR